MSGEAFLLFLFLAAIFLLSFLAKQGKKERKVERPIQRSHPHQKPLIHKKMEKKQVLVEPVFKEEKRSLKYEVHRKKEKLVLSKKWQDKDSLKQAFLLSEVLKKVDEREFF